MTDREPPMGKIRLFILDVFCSALQATNNDMPNTAICAYNIKKAKTFIQYLLWTLFMFLRNSKYLDTWGKHTTNKQHNPHHVIDSSEPYTQKRWIIVIYLFFCGLHAADEDIPEVTIWYNDPQGTHTNIRLAKHTPLYIHSNPRQHMCQALRDQILAEWRVKKGVDHTRAGAQIMHKNIREHFFTKRPFYSDEIEGYFAQIEEFLQRGPHSFSGAFHNIYTKTHSRQWTTVTEKNPDLKDAIYILISGTVDILLGTACKRSGTRTKPNLLTIKRKILGITILHKNELETTFMSAPLPISKLEDAPDRQRIGVFYISPEGTKHGVLFDICDESSTVDYSWRCPKHHPQFIRLTKTLDLFSDISNETLRGYIVRPSWRKAVGENLSLFSHQDVRSTICDIKPFLSLSLRKLFSERFCTYLRTATHIVASTKQYRLTEELLQNIFHKRNTVRWHIIKKNRILTMLNRGAHFPETLILFLQGEDNAIQGIPEPTPGDGLCTESIMREARTPHGSLAHFVDSLQLQSLLLKQATPCTCFLRSLAHFVDSPQGKSLLLEQTKPCTCFLDVHLPPCPPR